ncbi:MAG TPA: hypothetical protein PLV83_06135 [Bacilli bacterium]|nr:hypothetical protein [Bacilli bacterium]
MKRFKTILALCLTVLLIATGCGKKAKDNDKNKVAEPKVNTNEGVIKDKVVEELTLTNTSLVSTGNSAVLVTKVTNPTNEDKYVKIFNITVKDKDGNIITTLKGYVGGVVPKGESREITSNVDRNLDNAYTVEYELVK